MTLARSVRGVVCLWILGALAIPAFADPDAAAIARNCVELITRKAAGCVAALGTQSTNAAARIDALQAGGNNDGARRAARAAATALNSAADRCIGDIRGSARRCVAMLTRLNADASLAESVRTAAERAVGEINTARAAALQAIRTALES